jgi:hypothetical protein
MKRAISTIVRAILGNDIAIKAYREEKLPFPVTRGYERRRFGEPAF